MPIYKLKKNFFDVKKDQKNKFVSFFYKIDPIFKMKSLNKKKGNFYQLYIEFIKHLEKKFLKKKLYIKQDLP